ncbi:MAG: GNAT family N-acetyltransferase [Proteobacteria bacterium]|nr:GNAT family N-acetyltransferase [Pseudomonadota bacterium]
MTETELITLSIPADADYFPCVKFSARECATRLGFPPRDCDRICLALEEAMLDAIRFGYGGEHDRLHISLARASMGLKMLLKSRGLALERENLPKYNPSFAQQGQDLTGLSFHLIQKMVDTVSLTVQDDGQIELSMLKRLHVQRIKDEAETDTPRDGTPRAEHAIEQYSLRLATPGDADAISRLALRAHGTVLFSEQIYYPERVREMIATGEMVSAVAVTQSGVMGHGGLVVQDSDGCIEELTYAVVDSRVRGQGCATDMARFLIDGARERGVYALQCFAVTSHVHSQRAIEHLDFRECALLLGTSSPARHWDHDDGERPNRIGNLLYTKFLQPTEPMRLHVPARHREMIGKLFALRSGPVSFVDTQVDALPTEKTQLTTHADFKEGWALITIKTYGADAVAQVQSQLANAVSGNLPVVQLMLPLSDPCTATLCERFEALGFFFAGVGTGPDRGENLILQYLNGIEPGFDSVYVHSDIAKELVEYVRGCEAKRG